MAASKGYKTSKKVDGSNFSTVQNMGSEQFGGNVAPKSLFLVGLVNVVSFSQKYALSPNKLEYISINAIAHGARVGDVVRYEDGTSITVETPVVKIIDVDNLVVINNLVDGHTVNPTQINVMRWITERFASDGSTLAALTPDAVKFYLNTVLTDTIEDTGTPANNRPMPMKLLGPNGDCVPNASNELPVNDADVLAALVAASLGTVLAFSLYDAAASPDITTAAYTELIADTGAIAGKKITIFNGQGTPFYLAVGAAAGEVDKILVPPGGFDGSMLELSLPINSRISAKAIGADISGGTIILNIMG